MTPFYLLCQLNQSSPEVQAMLMQNAAKIEAARKEALSKGISEDELRDKLLEKGYDLNNLKQSQLDGLEKAINDAISEIEIEKAVNNKNQADNKRSEEIKTKATKAESNKANVNLKDKKDQTTLVTDPDLTSEKVDASFDDLDAKQINKQEKARIVTDSSKYSSNMKDVAIYGQQFFENDNIDIFTNSNDIVPPNDYTLGPGDGIRVVIFGTSIFDGSYEVDKDGYIDPRTIPKIYLKGLEFGSAKKLIENRFKQRYVFETGQLEVSLKKSRTITVGVFGEVNQPGTFSNPAANSAFNLIVLAKGLTDIGSVRNIKIVSPGKGVRIYDVYKYMLDPSKSANVYLQDNDFIQVPVLGKVVNVLGSVARPYKYELLEKESLAQLLKYAGGYNANADRSFVQVVRYENGARVILEVKEKDTETFIPKNGDEVTVIELSNEIKNLVEVIGEVERPGSFQMYDGLKIAEILSKSRLIRTTRLDVGYVQRLNSDNSISYIRFSPDEAIKSQQSESNLFLQPFDKIILLSIPEYTDYYKVSSSGAIRNPGQFDYDPKGKMTILDLIILSGGVKPEALNTAYLISTDSATNERKYKLFELNKVLENPQSPDNVVLKPLDRVYIVSNQLVINESFVSVGGAVKSPGKFKYGEGMTLLDALTLAGGFTMQASTNRIEVYRVVFQNNQQTRVVAATFDAPRGLIMDNADINLATLQPYDMIEVREVPQFGFQKRITILGEVKYPGDYAITKSEEKIYDIIQKAGGLTSGAFPEGAHLERNTNELSGPVLIDLLAIMKNPKINENIVLRENDKIFIPRSQELVSISGAVNMNDVMENKYISAESTLNIAYVGRKSAKYYIDEYAGGLSDQADKDKIYVEQANGRKIKTKKILFFRSYPKVTKGSKVFAGVKEVKIKDDNKEKADWGKIVTDGVAQATAILTMILLINNINR